MGRRRVVTHNRLTSVMFVCILGTACLVGFITLEPKIASGGGIIYVGFGPGNHTSTIWGGIDLANEGDTVFVYSGTYFENLIIDKSINLTGEDRNTTIIDGKLENAIYINSTQWVNVKGFTITNSTRGIMVVMSTFITIQENEISNNNANGIESHLTSNNNYINNIVHGQYKEVGGGGHGFFFGSCPYSNNSIMGNIVYGNEGEGIHLEDGTTIDDFTFWNNSITNNTVYNNTGDGIFIDLGTNNSIINNIVHNNGLDTINPHAGIRIHETPNNIILGNTVYNNDNGILLGGMTNNRDTVNNSIVGNTIYNNDFVGIGVSDATNNTFSDNLIFDNSNNIYLYQQTTGNEFINCILKNARYYEFNLTEDSHAILLNTTFNTTSVYYGDMLSTLTIKWFMHVHVIYNSGNPVSGAEVWINDTFGTNILNGSADSQGWIRWIVVTEYVEQDLKGDHKGNRIYHTPHNATAGDGILWGYAYPEPFMDESKTITIVLGGSTFVNLKPGWNLISLPRIQSDPDLKTIMQSIEGDYDNVQWYNLTDTNDPWKQHQIHKPSELNDLNEINHSMGFWIHVTNPKGTTLVVFGNVFSFNQNIPLYPGWNLVGYPSLTNYNRTIGMNNINFGSDVDSIWTYNTTKLKWVEISNGDYLERGRGYWVHSKVEKVWNVPL